jgi:hypothetical protein
MSIANRHPIVRNIINNKKNPISLQPNKKWNLILFRLYHNSIEADLEKFIDDQIVKTLKYDFAINYVYIYTYQSQEKNQFYDHLIKKYDAKLVELPNTDFQNTMRLSIIKKFIDGGQNSIFISNNGCCVNGCCANEYNKNDVSFLNSNNDIFAYVISVEKMNKSFQQIANKLNMGEIVSPDILIIPYSIPNKIFIDSSFKIAAQLKINNEELAINIALSINYMKQPNNIKNIESSELANYFLNYFFNKNHLSEIKEIKICSLPHSNVKHESIQSLFLPFNHKDYIYYPYFDVNGEPSIIDQTFEFGQDLVKLPHIFNTNGFKYENIPDKKYYSTMFKRFGEKTSGLFIKKDKNMIIVPKILHHVWLNDTPVTNYTNSWQKILKEPWKYNVWTKENLQTNVLNNNRWNKLYTEETNVALKILVAYLAILEKYGGFIIDSFIIPLKLVPDEMLTHKFMLSFADEKNSGTKLSYRIISSVPGSSLEFESQKNSIKYDAARRPFEGINNFFIDIKLQQQQKMEQKIIQENESINETTNPLFFDKLYDIISNPNNPDKIYLVEKFLVTNADTIIYPSYYFNPNYYIYPKKLVDCTVCINLWKLESANVRTKTDIKRTYKISTQGIVAKLSENPRDRFRNNNKIE